MLRALFCLFGLSFLFAAHASPASANPYPSVGTPGVTDVCKATPSYACAKGGYNASTVEASGWPWTNFGVNGKHVYATFNSYGPHNCTLYAAYRLYKNGSPPINYYLGNAGEWWSNAPNHGVPVNHTPAIGSIADWVYGNYGHVAYVESVSANSIVVSEDSAFINETRQERIDRTSKAWPDYFIHFLPDQGGSSGNPPANAKADINRDGVVNIFDLSILLNMYGFPWHLASLPADINGDGFVNVIDLSILLSNYGRKIAAIANVQPARSLGIHLVQDSVGALSTQSMITARSSLQRIGVAAVGRRIARWLGAQSRSWNESRQALSVPKLIVATTQVTQGSRASLLVDAPRVRDCALSLVGPGRRRTSRFRVVLRGRRYASFAWRLPRNVRRGRWLATVECARSSGASTRLRQQIRVTGTGSGAASIAAAPLMAARALKSPPPRAILDAGACSPSSIDSTSGYCRGGAAEYVYGRRPYLTRLGAPAAWWAKTNRHKGKVPLVGSVAWWPANRSAPVGHVAYVERVGAKTITVGEAGVYGRGVVDRALLPRRGRGAPIGYIYARRVGTASLSLWPLDIEVRAGDTFTMNVALTVNGDSASTATATLSYPSSGLQVLSADLDPTGPSDTIWGTPRVNSTPGTLQIKVARSSGVTGTHPIAVVRFRALRSGSASVAVSSAGVHSTSAGDPIPITVSAASSITLDPALPAPATSELSFASSASGVAAEWRKAVSPAISVGQQFTVPVYAHVVDGHVNAVVASISYPPGLLSFVSSSVETSVWNTTAVNQGGSGSIDLEVASLRPQTGDVLVSTLTFKAVAPGNADVSFTSESRASDATNYVDTLVKTSSATYTITP